MTEYVHLPNTTFSHDRLHLAPPNGLQGGAYFSMLYYKDAPLYIQTPKCTSRQGVVPGKRPHIDLMFSNHDGSFLEWLEALEADAVRLIYEKRNMWISSDIDKSDIEAGFTSPVRPYKGGKHYLIRAHIQPSKHLAMGSSCSVFDENERPVSVDHIKPDHQMYAVLEFQGIKFTARSFQLEVALKQVLLVPNVPLFQSCVIRRPHHALPEPNKSNQTETQNEPHMPIQPQSHAQIPSENPTESSRENPSESSRENPSEIQPTEGQIELSTENTIEPSTEGPKEEQSESQRETQTENPTEGQIENPKEDPVNTLIQNQNQNQNPTEADMQEVNLDVLEELEHMHLKLKKPTEVYYDMYRIAKQKAKELKKGAIAAYLEAKQIKSAHMLEDSESDSENENDSDDYDFEDACDGE